MKRVTLCYVTRWAPHREVLLGLKKRGFGAGKWNGFGGKIEPGESPRDAAVRELLEECRVRIRTVDLTDAGTLTFRFPARPSFDHHVRVFVTNRWSGAPAETDEMRPEWYRCDRLPLGLMWDDDRFWLPLVLGGERINAVLHYRPDNETVARMSLRRVGRFVT